MTGLMYGLWPSPITPKSLSEALRLSEPMWDSDGRTVGWLEGRSDRGVVVVQPLDGQAARDLSGARSVRARVGYGGGDLTLAGGAAWFVGDADQRIYRQEISGGPARPLTPPFGAAATPVVSPDGRWVAYVHSADEIDAIALVDSGGQAWPLRIGVGRDFYMQPVWDPTGRRLAWIEWDHPNMPWDGTELRVVELDTANGSSPPVVVGSRIVAGGPATAILQPAFSKDGATLYYISDRSGWGQLMALTLATNTERALTTGEWEHGAPAWVQGLKRYTLLPSGRLVVIRSRGGFDRLVVVDPAGGPEFTLEADPLEARFQGVAAAPDAERVVVIASGPTRSPRIVTLDIESTGATRAFVRRRATDESVPPEALSSPEAVCWTGHDGATVHGLYYPPAGGHTAPPGAPPLIVMVHGGPTGQATADWNPAAQFYTTRGYAVLMPNYRGSTGYGRDYMQKLRLSWGVYDVEDCRSGALWLAASGRVDGSRLVIAGGSAGGYTVLQSLIDYPGTYRAGLCYFAVSNQFLLAADTHKFEARYSDALLGPLPEAAAVYRERSPLFHADRIKDPIAVFQGENDLVVPRVQSDELVASLKARGIPHEYHVYAGEGHGWRKSETIESFHTTIARFLTQYVIHT